MFHDDDTLLGTLSEQLRSEEVFDRERKQTETRALGLLLHDAGLSCRRTSQLVTLLAEPVMHNPISAWYRRAVHLFREQPAKRHERLVIDETGLHIEKPREDWPDDVDKDAGEHLIELYLWAAIDPDTEEIVHVAVTEGRGGVEALGFLKGVLARCDHKPRVHVDRGVWYPWPLDALGFEWQVTSGGVRNKVETWFGVLKERIGQFRRRWPANSSKQEVQAWVEAFAWLFNQDPAATC